MVGSIVYFRPKLKQARADAKKAETEASAMEYSHLLERINTMEEMYQKQGEALDELRNQLLRKGQENFELQQRIIQVEAENAELKIEVNKLREDVNAYKTLMNKS